MKSIIIKHSKARERIITMISSIIFDLDGTLIDSKEDIIGSANAALRFYGKKPVAVAEGIQHVGRGANYLLEKLMPGASPDLINKCHAYFLDYYEKNPVVHTKIYDGVIEVLQHFDKFPLFLVTNKNEKIATIILEKLNLLKYFKKVIGADTYPQLKPNPFAIFEIMKTYSLKESQILMVGDTDVDIQFGINAKVKTCRFENDFGALGGARLAKEDTVIRHFSELIAVVEGLS